MKKFIPERIYYEEKAWNYLLGKSLLEKYRRENIAMEMIENHNSISSLQAEPNKSFPKMKNYLIIGTRKTHKYTENHKVSDFLVPFTSSGCTAMCLYCYLVCSYNKCAYLRLFVNREEMMTKLIKKAAAFADEKVFEVGANSDLVLENEITGNLKWTIEEFVKQPKGKLTFPTKFHMIDSILDINHQRRILFRVSLNPEYIITNVEYGTSSLVERVAAINQLCDADYPVGVLIAPVIFLDGWKELYVSLFQQLAELLSEKAKQQLFFEIIFMTYSFVHDKINQEAFPNALEIYQKDLMTGRGRGKYWYKNELRNEGEVFFREQLAKFFPNNQLLYIV